MFVMIEFHFLAKQAFEQNDSIMRPPIISNNPEVSFRTKNLSVTSLRHQGNKASVPENTMDASRLRTIHFKCFLKYG